LTEEEKREKHDNKTEHDAPIAESTKSEKENPHEYNTQREKTKQRDNYFQRVIHIAEREGKGRGLTAEEAQDCAMDFILRYLLAAPDSPKGDPGSPKGDSGLKKDEVELIHKPEPWLIRCTRNAAINAYHKRERRQETPVEQEDIALSVVVHTNASDPVFALLQQCEQDEIATLLDNLEDGPRQVFMRCCLEGDSISEVATALGKTPNAIRLTLTRCRRRLAVLVGRSIKNTTKSLVSLSLREEIDEKT
jgi:RNA polymerase sigma factor (sigma-70 family)